MSFRPVIRWILPLLAFLLIEGNIPASSLQSSPSNGLFAVGYRVIQMPSGINVAVWYPTSDRPKSYSYSKIESGLVAYNGTLLTSVGRFPLVLFSHGLGGGANQSIFFTETLARHGYIVAAPDHRDAIFRINGIQPLPNWQKSPPLSDPAKWTAANWIDRRNDLEEVLNYLLATSPYREQIDADKIGGAGHSLGGYSIAGLCGGWNEWKDSRIKAALLFSPYVLPFVLKNRISSINVPTMYQGAAWDVGITPSLVREGGAYDQARAPKYLLKFNKGGHFEWTNLIDLDEKSSSVVLKNRPTARLIDAYGIAFLNKYLKGIDSSLLTKSNPLFSVYRYEP